MIGQDRRRSWVDYRRYHATLSTALLEITSTSFRYLQGATFALTELGICTLANLSDRHFNVTMIYAALTGLLGVAGLSIVYYFALDPEWNPLLPWPGSLITGCILAGLSITAAMIAKRRGDVPGADGNAYFQVGGLFLNVVAFAVVPRVGGDKPDVSTFSLVVAGVGLLMAVYGFWGAFVRPSTPLAAKTREYEREKAEKQLLERRWSITRPAARAVGRRRIELADPANSGRVDELKIALENDLIDLARQLERAESLT